MHTNEQWLRDRGFTKQADGSFSKPKRTVSRVRSEAAAVAEPVNREAQHRVVPREAIYPGRVSILIKSYVCGNIRDPDNILQKYAIDCLRYAGIIRNDTRECIVLEPIQETRVSTKKEEGFEVLITPL